jgi:WD40 repeat protein
MYWSVDSGDHLKTFAGHSGWVWTLDSLSDSRLISGSWDSSIRLWDVENGVNETHYKTGSPVLSLAKLDRNDSVVYYSLYSHVIAALDFREPCSPSQQILSSKIHRKPILCLEPYKENYLISGSEDTFVKCIDIRMNGIVHEKKLPSMVLAMHCNDGHVVATTKDQCVYFLDPNDLTLCGSNLDLHDKKITSINYSSGCLITGSADSTVKVWEPTLEPAPLAQLSDHTNCITDVAYRNGVLCTVGADCRAVVYTPINDVNDSPS